LGVSTLAGGDIGSFLTTPVAFCCCCILSRRGMRLFFKPK
jgi:hypothetical protein